MIKAQVYARNRGCCGINVFDFLASRGVEVEFISAQIPANSTKAFQIAREAGLKENDIFFPIIVIGGEVVAGFMSDKLNDIIEKNKEQ